MSNAVLTFEILAIIALCVVAYVTVSPRLAQEDILSLQYGVFIRAAFPIVLTIFGVVATLVLISVSSRRMTK